MIYPCAVSRACLARTVYGGMLGLHAAVKPQVACHGKHVTNVGQHPCDAATAAYLQGSALSWP